MPPETLNPQRRQERFHLKRFVELFPDFPTGSLQFGDKPDLIVSTDTHCLGIEHTQLFRVAASSDIIMSEQKNVIMQEQENLQERVVARARQIYEEGGGIMLWLYVQFSWQASHALNKHDVEKVASKLAGVVDYAVKHSRVSSKDVCWQMLEKWNYDKRFANLFPSQIDQITFQRADRPGFVLWGVPRSCVVSNVTTQYIQEKINGKESKVGNYRNRCSEVWLLLVAGNGTPSSYFNITPDVAGFTFQSGFDRVFYFENFDNKIVELKIACMSQVV